MVGHLRGLCRTCYNAAGNLVRTKKTTWTKLERDGKCYSAKGRNSKTKDWLLK